MKSSNLSYAENANYPDWILRTSLIVIGVSLVAFVAIALSVLLRWG